MDNSIYEGTGCPPLCYRDGRIANHNEMGDLEGADDAEVHRRATLAALVTRIRHAKVIRGAGSESGQVPGVASCAARMHRAASKRSAALLG